MRDAATVRITDDDTTYRVQSFALKTLLPSKVNDFARYPGSLTTPPCNESVTWTVFTKPITITREQVHPSLNLWVFRATLFVFV